MEISKLRYDMKDFLQDPTAEHVTRIIHQYRPRLILGIFYVSKKGQPAMSACQMRFSSVH